MKALGDYIHSKGLKFGIYSDAGRKTCGDVREASGMNIKMHCNMPAGEWIILNTIGVIRKTSILEELTT